MRAARRRGAGRAAAAALACAALIGGRGAAQATPPAGTLAYDTVPGPSLAGNALGDASARAVTVYVPPGYAAHPERRYPTVYLLHGYGGDERGWTAGPGRGVAGALDSLAAADPRAEMIVVMPNAHTRLGGSMYANSAAGGRWEDYVAADLVRWVDAHYRTVPSRDARGIAGHSMGGYGALRLDMRRPDVFGAVYATSPCCISWGDLGGANRAWDTTLALRDTAALATTGFYPHVYTALAAAWSPHLGGRPFPVAYPFRGRAADGAAVADSATYARWTAAMLVPEVPRYRGALRSLRGLAFDVGTREQFSSIAGGTRALDSAFTRAGVAHAFEVFDGDHVDRVQQRLATRAFPFFAARLGRGNGGTRAPAVPVGRLVGGAVVRLVPAAGGGWGLAVDGAGRASAAALAPVRLEFWGVPGDTAPRALAAAYDGARRTAGGAEARATVRGPGGAVFAVRDVWSTAGRALRLRREVTVVSAGDTAAGARGFMSGVVLALRAPAAVAGVRPGGPRPDDARLFAPGMIYGGPAHLTDSAIGGARAIRRGAGNLWIREDRLPAPLFGVQLGDGSSLALLDPAPNGATTRADAEDTAAVTLVDSAFRFASLGVHAAPRGADAGRVEAGLWYPGTEGEATYAGNTYPGGQLARWRRRYHPVRAGFVQRYALDVRVGREASFPDFYRDAWRWAWTTLAPRVTPEPIDVARRLLVDALASRVETINGHAGIGQWVSAKRGDPDRADRRATLGFVGKNLEAAEFMLAESLRPARTGADSARADTLRARGTRVVENFLRLPVVPPAGEGLDLDTGRPVVFNDAGGIAYLRPLTDDMKALVRALRRERLAGRAHDAWLAWATRFADWLLAQQRADGSFPRAWVPGTGAAKDSSSQSTFNAVPFLALLGQETARPRYLAAAERAGEFAWRHGQAEGVFVGGTIDNPDVIDKEAGTLSTEAYLALYGATGDRRWVERARRSAEYAETWIYLWDVPAAAGEDPASLGWKPGVPTTGAQLISTGHSLTDAYMAFDVDEYARLYRLTGDAHFREVARVLLHDTKHMIALPAHPYDLKGLGWQQEHWTFAPRRGNGLHRGWLPWVTTAHLNGIVGLEEQDPALYREFTGAAPNAIRP